MTDHLKDLEKFFADLPGIGPRQAKRLAHHIMERAGTFAIDFAHALENARKSTRLCKKCFGLFSMPDNSDGVCKICTNRHNSTTLMIVAKTADIEHIESSGVYQGLYFALGGNLPLIRKRNAPQLRIDDLLRRLSNDTALGEVILAFSASTDGEHTGIFVEDSIKDKCREKNIKLSTLGRGLSTGTEIEYADNETMKNALINKKNIQ